MQPRQFLCREAKTLTGPDIVKFGSVPPRGRWRQLTLDDVTKMQQPVMSAIGARWTLACSASNDHF
jgi:hypothetical protein